MKSFFLHTNAEVSIDQLKAMNILAWSINLDNKPWEENSELQKVITERGYKHHDIVEIFEGKFPPEKLDSFFEEHLHEDEEVRFILEGSGFFDVRDQVDRWIRIHVCKGDLLVVPAGIYHRFCLDQKQTIKALRLFQDDPKWTPINRGTEAEATAARIDYKKEVSPYHLVAAPGLQEGSSSSSVCEPSTTSVQGPNGIGYVLEDRAGAYASYPHVRRANGLLYLSGTSCRRPDNTHAGAVQKPDGTWDLCIAQQTEAVIQNLDVMLQRVGAGLKHLLDVTVYLVDMKDYREMNAVYNRYFDKASGPTRTCVAVHQLPHPNLLIEIKAVALEPTEN